MTELHTLRKPCSNCGKALGKIAKRNGQNVVYCIYCDMFQYNAPKTETGEEVRSISTIRDGIKPRLRMEILERDGRCVVCGAAASDSISLMVGHLVSVKDGYENCFTDEFINSPENLATMCEECNAGLGDWTVDLRLMLRILKIRVMRREDV